MLNVITNERDLLIAYRQAREKFEDLDKQLKEARLNLDTAEGQLVEALIASNATSTAKYEGVGFVSLQKPVLYASYDKASEDKVFDLLKQEGMESIIKPTVHHKSLSGFVAGLIEKGKSIPDFVTYYMKQGVRFYKTEGSI